MFGGAYCKENIYSFKSSILTLQALTVISIKFIIVISVLIQPPRVMRIGHFHYGVILLQRPESFWFLFSHANKSFFFFLLSTGITKFEFEKENEMNSGSCSKMTPSCLENGLLRI